MNYTSIIITLYSLHNWYKLKNRLEKQLVSLENVTV